MPLESCASSSTDELPVDRARNISPEKLRPEAWPPTCENRLSCLPELLSGVFLLVRLPPLRVVLIDGVDAEAAEHRFCDKCQ